MLMTGSDHEGSGFSQFLRLHQPRLRAVALRFSVCGSDADDLVQDTMERALVHFAELSPLRPEAQRAWLVRTLSHRFIDIHRHRGKEVVGLPEVEVADAAMLPGGRGESPNWERITAEDLRRAVDRLPGFLAEPFRLRSAGQSYKAIAQELKASQGTVASWLFQARQQLRKLLIPVAEQAEVHP
jgi:RNA polymerase sigma-70 factor (ECF subfamily)